MKYVKNILFAIALMILPSCEKGDIIGTDCNCGIVVNDPMIPYVEYYVVVKNNCTGHKRTFKVDYYDWHFATQGSTICFTDITEW